MQKVIKKIHRKFDTASEKILAEAKRIIANSPSKSLGDRVEALGFWDAKPIKDSKELSRSRNLVRLIEEYHITYPDNKFITEDVVNKICEKYGLVFSKVSNYTGDIPEKNIAEMEKFVKVYNVKLPQKQTISDGIFTITLRTWTSWSESGVDEFQEPASTEFKIVAPEKDFNTKGKTKKGYELIDDPIVLYPVRGGYIIVTKWGLEASDELVVNEKHN